MLVVLNRSSPVNYCYRLDEGLQYRIIEKMIVFRKEVRSAGSIGEISVKEGRSENGEEGERSEQTAHKGRESRNGQSRATN